jgi:hypothetical protein
MSRVRGTILGFFTNTNLLMLLLMASSMLLLAFRPKRIPIIFRILVVPLIVLTISIFCGLPGWFVENLQPFIARYPFISAWLHQFGLFWNSNIHHEAHYRFLPMLGTFALGYFVLWKLRKNNVHPVTSIIAATAFAIIPSVIFHSTTLYLDIPPIVLLMISMYYLKELLTRDFQSVKAHPAWLALITVGFFKETLCAIIFAILCLRIIVRGWMLLKKKQFNIKTIMSELGVIFCITLPLFLYLICRTQFAENRRVYRIYFSNLFQIQLWKLAGLSLLDQYAPILALAVTGTAIGLYKKRYLWISAIWFVFVSHFLFHFLGKSFLVGYARFQLFLLGPLAALAIYALIMLAKRNQWLCACAVIMVFAVNLWMCPVDIVSGCKEPGWGARSRPYYADRYYPYREAIQWLKEYYPETPILIACTHINNMGFRWTCQKYQYQPKIEFLRINKNLNSEPRICRYNLAKTLKTASEKNVPLVMFLKTDDNTIISDSEKSFYGYTAFKIVANKYQSLVFYGKF